MTVALKFSPSRSSKKDVGLPDEWTVKKLGEICSDVFSGRSKRMSGGRFPLYGSTGQIGLCDDTLYSGDAILVARVGANAGTTNRVSGTYGVTDNTIIVKANSEVSTDFLFLKLVSANLNSMVFGSGQPLITGTQLKNLDIPLPPLPEQRAIAEALGDVDALIAAPEKLIAKKRAIKTASMQRLLTGKQRLPGFGEGCRYKQTEIGIIPEDWTITKLGEISSNVFSGRSKATPGGRYPLYGSTGQIGLCDDTLYTGDAILVARVGANAGTTNRASGTYGVTDNTIVVKANLTASTDYLFLKLVSANLNSMIFGSGQPLITGSQLKNLILALPPLPEQRAIAKVLGDVDALITALDKRLAKTKAIKQGMMEELLTGRTRLV